MGFAISENLEGPNVAYLAWQNAELDILLNKKNIKY